MTDREGAHVAIVTGANHGIGAATARVLAERVPAAEHQPVDSLEGVLGDRVSRCGELLDVGQRVVLRQK